MRLAGGVRGGVVGVGGDGGPSGQGDLSVRGARGWGAGGCLPPGLRPPPEDIGETKMDRGGPEDGVQKSKVIGLVTGKVTGKARAQAYWAAGMVKTCPG